MRHFVITIKGHEQSNQSAKRLAATGLRNGNIQIEKFEAITPSSGLRGVARDMKIDWDVLVRGLEEPYSNTQSCIAAFLSHFSLWKFSADKDEEVTIFEHDAVIVAPIPNDLPYNGCINLGRPSYGKFNNPSIIGVNPLTSKQYFPGAHGYRVKPNAAKNLIAEARKSPRPTDVFLNTTTFPFLQELYPWPVEARDSFTTIQKKHGCLAKHNYFEGYQHLAG